MDFRALVPVVAILASLGFGWIWLRYMELKAGNRQWEHRSLEQAEEKRRLEKRIAVLERIATDRGLSTAEQIDALRERESEQLR